MLTSCVAVFALLVTSFATASAQTVTPLHSFPKYGTTTYPNGPAVQGLDGNLYSYTDFSGYGSVFRERTNGNATPLYVFTSNDGGATPLSPVLLASDGNWYGATGAVIYRITPGGAYTILHSFGSADGNAAIGSLIEVNGKLYGTTVGGRAVGPSVYTYNYTSRTFSVLYQFASSQFAYSGAALVQASDGNVYGVGTGSDSCGAAFKMTPSGTLLNVYSFDCGLSIGSPNFAMVVGGDGNFYGTGAGAEPFPYGAVFKMDRSGVVTLLHTFGGFADGSSPRGGLALGTDGNLYGSTLAGGVNNSGAIYQISSTGSYQQLYSFGLFGWDPSGLVQHTNGKFYGFVMFSSKSSGVFYDLDMGLGPFIAFVLPTGQVGYTAQILGQGLTGTTSITFNGVQATSFNVASDTYLTAVVPTGATTGPVVVTTPTGTFTSNRSFLISK